MAVPAKDQTENSSATAQASETPGTRRAAVELLRLTVRRELLWSSRHVDAISEVIAKETAAPEMLEALEGILPYIEEAERAGLVGHEGCHWPVEFVRAAIQKARGGQ